MVIVFKVKWNICYFIDRFLIRTNHIDQYKNEESEEDQEGDDGVYFNTPDSLQIMFYEFQHD